MKKELLKNNVQMVKYFRIGTCLKEHIFNALRRKHVFYYISVLYSNNEGKGIFIDVVSSLFPKYAHRVVRAKRSASEIDDKDERNIELPAYDVIGLPNHTAILLKSSCASVKTLRSGATFELDINPNNIVLSDSLLTNNDKLTSASFIEFYFVGPDAHKWYRLTRKRFLSMIPDMRVKKNQIHVIQLDIVKERTMCPLRFVDSMDSLIFDQKQELLRLLNRYIKGLKTIEKVGGRMTRGVLLYGPPGIGKTSFVLSYAKMMNFRCIEFVSGYSLSSVGDDDGRHVSQRSSDRSKKSFPIDITSINAVITRELRDGCSFVIALLDEIDLIIDEVGSKAILKLLDSMPDRVITIATTNNISRLDAPLLRAGRFDYKIELTDHNIPNAIELCKYYNIPNPMKFLKEQFPYLENSSDTDASICPAELKLRIMDYLMDSVMDN